MNWLTARLREPSTWRGLIWLLTACGVTLRPEVWEQVTAVGMAAAGLLGVITREDPKTVKIELPSIELVAQSLSAQASPARRIADFADSVVDHNFAPDRLHNSEVRSRIHPEPARPENPIQQPVQQPEPPGWNG